MANASTSITISYADNGTATGPQDVTLTIKDYCTDAIIPGATVTLSDYGTQISDGAGQVTFLQVEPGTHALTVTATGYLNNGTDSLANDSITV